MNLETPYFDPSILRQHFDFTQCDGSATEAQGAKNLETCAAHETQKLETVKPLNGVLRLSSAQVALNEVNLQLSVAKPRNVRST